MSRRGERMIELIVRVVVGIAFWIGTAAWVADVTGIDFWYATLGVFLISGCVRQEVLDK